MHITALELFTADLGATRHFYKEVLGLPLLEQTERSVTFSAGSTRLIFTAQDNAQPEYHIAFTIASNKLHAALEAIGAHIPIIEVPEQGRIVNFPNWKAESFYFYDPGGNILEYIARFNLDNATSGPFTTEDICCISEAGLVTDDVPALAGQIGKVYGIPIYARQPATVQFTAMGDDYGLLLLVARNRHWFPTSRPAGIYPLNIIFKDKNGVEQTLRYMPESQQEPQQ